jgi:uncharacterized membrane protein
MSLLPSWAPNLHPLVVHFPIVLLFTAVLVDIVYTVFERPAWLAPGVTSLSVAGALAVIAAYLTGSQASTTVYIPGMAHPAVESHETWALVTTGYFILAVLIRWSARMAGFPRNRRQRAWLVVGGLVGLLLLYQTAERGARLVFEYGVGVIGAPGQSES